MLLKRCAPGLATPGASGNLVIVVELRTTLSLNTAIRDADIEKISQGLIVEAVIALLECRNHLAFLIHCVRP